MLRERSASSSAPLRLPVPVARRGLAGLRAGYPARFVAAAVEGALA